MATAPDPARCSAFFSAVDPAGLITVDPEAEATIAGCALASGAEARATIQRLDLADIYDHRLVDVIEAAACVSPEVRDGQREWADAVDCADFALVAHGCAARVHVVARATGDPVAWLAGLVTRRAVAADHSGWFATRVAAAADARRQRRALLEHAEALDVDLSAVHRVDPAPAVLALIADAAANLGREVVQGDQQGAIGVMDALVAIVAQLGVDPATAETDLAAAFARGRHAATGGP